MPPAVLPTLAISDCSILVSTLILSGAWINCLAHGSVGLIDYPRHGVPGSVSSRDAAELEVLVETSALLISRFKRGGFLHPLRRVCCESL